MSNTCPTVQISADNEQGFIVINESDFDPEVHLVFGEEAKEKSMTKAELHAALTEKGIDHKPAMSKAELQSMLDAA